MQVKRLGWGEIRRHASTPPMCYVITHTDVYKWRQSSHCRGGFDAALATMRSALLKLVLALRDVWSGVPASHRGVPTSTGIWRAASPRNSLCSDGVNWFQGQKGNGRIRTMSRRQATLFSLTGERRLNRPCGNRGEMREWDGLHRGGQLWLFWFTYKHF